MQARHKFSALSLRIAALSAASIMGAFLFGSAWAVSPRPESTPSRLVRDALAREAQGVDSGREALLQAALHQSPGYAPARWHSGYVKSGKRWAHFNEVAVQAASRRVLASYRLNRNRYPQTVEGQLNLAKWCSQRKLNAEARAHYTKVLELDPNHVEARARLGFRRVEGVWLSPQEISAARKRAREAEAALRKWRPRLEILRKQLQSSNPKLRALAVEKIKKIVDPAAIPAMELVLSTAGEKTAKLVIEALANMTAYEASIALSRHAVFASSVFVRQEAALKLKQRACEEYAPAMLAAMHSPIQTQAQIFRGPRGRLMYRHTFLRESQDTRESAVFDTAYERISLPGGDGRETLGRAFGIAQDTAVSREVAIAQENARNEELNRRICQLLAFTTGEENRSADPQAWWLWWNEYNEVFVAGQKPLRQLYSRSSVEVVDTTSIGSSSGGSMPMDCLAAGTPVWTLTGPAAIETIQVGDQVLAQDPDTGELAYKPVLRTTIRPRGPLVEINTGRYVIRTSGGHLFWRSGNGWARSRDVKAGMPLHTAKGIVRVRSVKKGAREERTYNLIVADFHSYFVGEDLVLSHDNTIRELTNAIVPGFSSR